MSLICYHCKNLNAVNRQFPWINSRDNSETIISLAFCDKCYPYIRYARFVPYNLSSDILDSIDLYFQFTKCHVCGDEENGLPRKFPYDDRHPFDYPMICDMCYDLFENKTQYKNKFKTFKECLEDALVNTSTQCHCYDNGRFKIRFNIKRMGKKMVKLSSIVVDFPLAGNCGKLNGDSIAIFHLGKNKLIKDVWLNGRTVVDGEYLSDLIF